MNLQIQNNILMIRMNIKHYPGLSLNKHPDGIGIPCCLKIKEGSRRKKNQPTKQSTQYLIDSNKFPLPEGRMGFLSEQLELFFNIDNKKYIKNKSKIIKGRIRMYFKIWCRAEYITIFNRMFC